MGTGLGVGRPPPAMSSVGLDGSQSMVEARAPLRQWGVDLLEQAGPYGSWEGLRLTIRQASTTAIQDTLREGQRTSKGIIEENRVMATYSHLI